MLTGDAHMPSMAKSLPRILFLLMAIRIRAVIPNIGAKITLKPNGISTRYDLNERNARGIASMPIIIETIARLLVFLAFPSCWIVTSEEILVICSLFKLLWLAFELFISVTFLHQVFSSG